MSGVIDDLDGKVVVVTDATRGVGRGIARYLAANGARLVVSARGGEGLAVLSGELDDLGAGHHTPGLDDPEALARFERAFSKQPAPRDGRLEEDIAPVVGFLLSDASAYVTGQT